MSTYGGKELANAFRTVRKNTIQIAEDIPESKYDFVPAPEFRSVGRLLVHLATSHRFWDEIHRVQRRTTLVGFDFLPFIELNAAEEAKPRTKAEIIELLRTEGDSFAAWMETLTPEFLGEQISQPDGNTRSRFEQLLGVKEHEMHHRGQLMLIERQLGIVPHLTRVMQERMAQMRSAKAGAASAAS